MFKRILRMILAVLVSLNGLFLVAQDVRYRDLSPGAYIDPDEAAPPVRQRIDAPGGLSGYRTIGTEGALSLFFNVDTGAVAVEDNTAQKVWYSAAGDNPDFAGAVLTCGSDEVAVTIERDGTRFFLGNQDRTFSYEIISNECMIKVTYQFTCVQEDVPFVLTLPVQYYLKNSTFYAEADLADIQNQDGFAVREIGLLQGFGLVNFGQDHYLLLPDGPGALLRLSPGNVDEQQLSLPVYGEDKALRSSVDAYKPDKTRVLLPVFGLRRENSAMLCVAEQGDALMTVHAKREGQKDALSRAEAAFTVTPGDVAHQVVTGRFGEYAAQEPYTGVLRLCYRFLNESSANYSGMAVACREQLMRAGFLSASSMEDDLSTPMNITLIGQSRRPASFLGVKYDQVSKETSFGQSRDIVERCLAKGVANMNVRMMGALSGGMFAGEPSGMEYAPELGGKSAYLSLQEFMDTRQLALYTDLDLISVYDTTPTAVSPRAARALLDTPAMILRENPIAPGTVVPGFLLSQKALNARLERLVYASSGRDTLGVSIADAGRFLYSDFNAAAPVNRQQIRDDIASLCENSSNNKRVMVDTGNAYSLKRAQVIVNQPMEATLSFSGYEEIPFLQMVLHGMIDYSGEALNLSQDYEQSFLRCIEYGASPAFLWLYAPEEDKNVGPRSGSLSYTAWLDTAAECYTQAQEALNPVRGERFIHHEKLADGLFVSEYDSGAQIYVNYSNTSQTVNEIEVAPKSFRVIHY